MMSTTATTASRLLLCARNSSKPSVQRLATKIFLSTATPRRQEPAMPQEAFDMDGHLRTDHLEYLDVMVEKTCHMERSLSSLQSVYAQKKQALDKDYGGGTVKWMDNSDIQKLFQEADMRKKELQTTLEELQSLSKKVKQLLPFAVDSPDGQVDGQLDEEIVEINKIIDSAAQHEDTESIEYHHKMDDAILKDRIRDPEHDW